MCSLQEYRRQLCRKSEAIFDTIFKDIQGLLVKKLSFDLQYTLRKLTLVETNSHEYSLYLTFVLITVVIDYVE